MSFAATYFLYGGRLRVRHLLVAGVATALMQFIVFPLFDLQRGFSRDLSASEYASETAETALNLLDPERHAGYRDQLNQGYLSWDTRLYYGDPTGFLDRFSPSPLDETVHYIGLAGPFGFDQLVEQLTYGVPNMFLRLVGIERPARGGEMLETAVYGWFTNMNYGVMAEVFSTVGLAYYLPALTVIVFFYVIALRALYGRMTNNYFAAFGFSTLYFSFAVSDLGEIIPQLTIQGPLNVIVLAATAIACGRIGPFRPMARSSHDVARPGDPAGDAVI